jgi:hypothetical protein
VQSGITAAIDPVASGTKNQRITFQAEPGSAPTLTFAGGGNNVCVRLQRDYITVRGITCRGAESGNLWPYSVSVGVRIEDGADFNRIERSTFYFIADAGVDVAGVSTYNQILDNSIAQIGCRPEFTRDCTGTSGDAIRLRDGAKLNLVQGNDIADARGWGIRLDNQSSNSVGNHVIRSNRIANNWWGGISISETSGAAAVLYNLVEGNLIVASSSQPVAALTSATHSGIKISARENVVRFNSLIGAGAGVSIVASATEPNVLGNKIYNNSIVGSLLPGISIVRTSASTPSSTSVINNTIVDNTASDVPSGIPGLGISSDAQVWLSGGTSFGTASFPSEISNNLIVADLPEKDVFAIEGFGSCLRVSDQGSASCPTTDSGSSHLDVSDNIPSAATQSVNPKDAGRPLTSTRVSCSGGDCCPAIGGTESEILVKDSRFFSPGLNGGGTVVLGDEVQIQDVAGTYRVKVVDRTPSAGKLRVTPLIPAGVCGPNKSVHLLFTGSAPDIGPVAGQ